MESVVSLSLADNSAWTIVSKDQSASWVVSQLADAMQLRHRQFANAYRLHVAAHGAAASERASVKQVGLMISRLTLPVESPKITVYVNPSDIRGVQVRQLRYLSQVIASYALVSGGLLLHGALLAREGQGVLLTGPSGVGKTTASSRVPPPWRALSDDATLVVRDADGTYWAHPWPTWSAFLSGGRSKKSWNVGQAVPLRAIFFLNQAGEDRVAPIGDSEAVGRLVQAAEQVSYFALHMMDTNGTRALRIQRFGNVCKLVERVPHHILHLSLTGAFWEAIERALYQGKAIKT
jgi:SynChlorMet cassette protein ScmC